MIGYNKLCSHWTGKVRGDRVARTSPVAPARGWEVIGREMKKDTCEIQTCMQRFISNRKKTITRYRKGLTDVLLQVLNELTIC